MELKYKAKNVYKEGTDREQINSFCEGYKSFLNSCRTERLCAEQAQKKLEAAGFTRYNGEKLKAALIDGSKPVGLVGITRNDNQPDPRTGWGAVCLKNTLNKIL